MIRGHIFLMVICTVAGFNIFTKSVKDFETTNNDKRFGQSTVQSKEGVLITSPSSKQILSCGLDKCAVIALTASSVKGLYPIMAVSNSWTGEKERHMVCQQVRTQKSMSDHLNGDCFLLDDLKPDKIYPSVLDQLERKKFNESSNNNNNNNNSNNNNNNNNDDDDDDPGTEIAIVLDGSGSISSDDFERAKLFITTLMKRVWEKCFNCEFAVVQFGSKIRTELSLNETGGPKSFETVKNIKQIFNATVTASAMIYTVENVFVPENGSREGSKKIMIVLSDGAISLWDKVNLPKALNISEEKDITRFAIGVGKEEIKTKEDEMKKISSNNGTLFMVEDYKTLDLILSTLETTIIQGIEGIRKGEGFQFKLAETGFSSHIAFDGSLLFGAVGANDWSGGLILKKPNEGKSTFLDGSSSLNGSSSEPRFSYLGYSVVSARSKSGTLYISGAPRYNLTGAVFVFDATSHKVQDKLLGNQVGSYFGSVLCALDINQDSLTDYLLVGAPYFFQKAEEGRVFIFKFNEALGTFHKERWEWKGLENYIFARFGSAISSVEDLDGDGSNDVVVGAPLESNGRFESSGSIYIYNGGPGGLQRHHSQRISAAEVNGKLQHFGQSVSAFSNKKENKRQLYISVGSQGVVTVLKTIPVITFRPTMDVTPTTIRISEQTSRDIKKDFNLDICFPTKRKMDKDELSISYNIDVDAGQNKRRLFVTNESQREGIFTVRSDRNCFNLKLSYMGCNNCFSPIVVRVNFKLNTTEPSLHILDYFTPAEVTKEITFEKDCETGKECIGNISLSDSRLSENMVIIGLTKSLTIDFNLTNTRDSAYATTLLLEYPNMLLFNKFTTKMAGTGSVCENVVTEKISLLKCFLSHPVFKRNEQVNFSIAWQLSNKKSEMKGGEITANLTCENGGFQELDYKTFHFVIKNALKVQITGKAEPAVIQFTGKNIDKKELTFSFQLHGENQHNATIFVNVTFTYNAAHTKMSIKGFTPKDKCEIVKASKENLLICKVIDLQEITVKTEASIKDQDQSDEITAKATLGFDEGQFAAVEMGSMVSLMVRIIKMEVKRSLLNIIGGSMGGFLFLAIIIFLLFKCGFFKRRQQLDNARDE
ncbi:hypothetical protein DPEC_G00246390 [Dallia pectoralis]|uniref:Uncharacterized protein n=1 Tax=Dallia pectoralis TaxID=75939 RepID=A0ACC2FWF7_DALPE|nr:hypothetical protein DPEC_G00246390 [Dallia pectoralis]